VLHQELHAIWNNQHLWMEYISFPIRTVQSIDDLMQRRVLISSQAANRRNCGSPNGRQNNIICFQEPHQKVGLTSHTIGPQVVGDLVEKGIQSRSSMRASARRYFRPCQNVFSCNCSAIALTSFPDKLKLRRTVWNRL
jgi:hypothetical protein